MAEALAALGAIATVAQLIDYGLKSIKFARDLYKQYDDPKSTRQQLKQIEQVSIFSFLCFQRPRSSK
jgi:hypothetical protein